MKYQIKTNLFLKMLILINIDGSNDSALPGFKKLHLWTFSSPHIRKVKKHIKPNWWQIPPIHGHAFHEHLLCLSHGVHILVDAKNQMLFSREGIVATWNGTFHFTRTEHVLWKLGEQGQDQLLEEGSDGDRMKTSSRKKNQVQCHGEEHLALVVKEGKMWMKKKGILERENPRQIDSNVHSDLGRHPERVEKTREVSSTECWVDFSRLNDKFIWIDILSFQVPCDQSCAFVKGLHEVRDLSSCPWL